MTAGPSREASVDWDSVADRCHALLDVICDRNAETTVLGHFASLLLAELHAGHGVCLDPDSDEDARRLAEAIEVGDDLPDCYDVARAVLRRLADGGDPE